MENEICKKAEKMKHKAMHTAFKGLFSFYGLQLCNYIRLSSQGSALPYLHTVRLVSVLAKF